MEKFTTENTCGINNILNSSITVEEVGKVCKKLKSRKSVGVDVIPNEVLKCEKVHKIQTIFN